jgi:hypothetical protein
MKNTTFSDIDGTVADLTHRLKMIERSDRKAWNAFFDARGDNAPHDDIIGLMANVPLRAD